MSSGEVVFAILSGLAINECCDVSPWLARRVAHWSARRRYTDLGRARIRVEELEALIDARPGKLLKLLTAFGFAATALAALMRRAVSRFTRGGTAQDPRSHRSPSFGGVLPTGFWGSLTDGERERLRASGRDSVFDPGLALCVEGDPATHLYVILAGWTKVSAVTKEGRKMLLALRGPGDLIGELAGALDGYRTATVRAVTGVQAIAIAAEPFLAFLDANPDAARTYRRMITRRRQESASIASSRINGSCAQRLARLVVELGRCCGEPTEHGTTITVPMSHADLASGAGISRTTVVRLLRQWHERNLVGMRKGRLTIIDATALRRMADPRPTKPPAT